MERRGTDPMKFYKTNATRCKEKINSKMVSGKISKRDGDELLKTANLPGFYLFCIPRCCCLLLLTCATWETKPRIGFKARGIRYSRCYEAYFSTAGVRFLPHYTIDGSTIHRPPPRFWYVSEREIFSRDNTHGKLLATDHGTFGTTDFTSKYTAFTRWVFGGIRNRTRVLQSEGSPRPRIPCSF